MCIRDRSSKALEAHSDCLVSRDGVAPKAQVIGYGDRIEFLPVRPARALRGVLRGVDTSMERDEVDRV